MGTKQHSSDPITDAKKRRRVGFAKIDAGIEANECIKIYLVSSKEEFDAPDCFYVEPIDLNHFFEEDGKIYGYQGLKITIWVSSVSFHAYADVTFESTSDGGKGITDLKSVLQNMFAENLVETKDDFLQTFSTECHYVKSVVSNGEVLQQKTSNGYNGDSNIHLKAETSDVEVVRVVGSMQVGHLYCRLVPLVLLLVDEFIRDKMLCESEWGHSTLRGHPNRPEKYCFNFLTSGSESGSNPIDITDPRWEMYLLVQKKIDHQGDNQLRLLGFAALYRFYHYPDGLRLRLSQMLVLPPYQHRGYGRCLLEVLNSVAIRENAYDLTVEEPSDPLQHVRTCIDVLRLRGFDPIQHALSSVILRLKQENLSKKSQPCHFGPPVSAVEDVRKSLKINKKQFLQCWEVLIYVGLDPIDKYMETYRTIISDRIKADVIGKETGPAGKRVIEVPTDYDQEMSFVLFRSQNGEASSIEMDENQISPEEQLRQLVDMRMKEIKLIIQKVSLH